MRYVSACRTDPRPLAARGLYYAKNNRRIIRTTAGAEETRAGATAAALTGRKPTVLPLRGEGDVSELPRNGCHWTCAY